MLRVYPEDYIVSVDVVFTDHDGQPVTPTAVKAALWDGEDQLVEDFGDIAFDPSEGRVSVVIPAAFNRLAAGELQAARILRVEIHTASGLIRRSHSYIVEGEFRLQLMVNSFQSIEAAEILARDMPNLSGWSGADEDRRYAALIDAFNRLTRIPMRFRNPDPGRELTVEQAMYSEETIISRDAWPSVTEQEFHTWPAHFRKALRQAQLAEANELLEGDAISRRHRAGIISETIGESSMTLKGNMVDMGISKQALSYLSGHIYYNFRIARG